MSPRIRIVAGIALANALMAFTAPAPTPSAGHFECGDSGDHFCCTERESCPDTHTWCCHWRGDGTPPTCACDSPL
jgi:hypothetical protein